MKNIVEMSKHSFWNYKNEQKPKKTNSLKCLEILEV